MKVEKVEVQGPMPYALTEATTGALVREAFEEGKELVRLEVALAKEELESELEQAKRAAIGFGIALAASFVALALLGVALVFALGGTAIVALLVTAGYLVVAGGATAVGYKLLPKEPLAHTRRRLAADFVHFKDLKERLA